MSDWIYEPRAKWVKDSRLQSFLNRLSLSYPQLLEKSQKEVAWFWSEALKELGLTWETKPKEMLVKGLPFPEWAAGGRLSIAENCIDRHARENPNSVAAIFESDEPGKASQWTFSDLARESSFIAKELLEAGAKPGDRAALLMPMSPEMLASFFGVLRAGLTLVPIFSGYGREAILTRLRDSNARFAFVQKTTTRKGKEIPVAAGLQEVQKECPSLQKVFVLDRQEFLEGHQNTEFVEPVVKEAEDECMLLYTSGTTGNPKGCVHTVFGVLATCGKELGFAFDVKSEDRFFWYTDIGWMMGPWELFGALQLGATTILYEGVPDYPTADRLWEIVRDHKVTHLGISPTAVRVLKKKGSQLLDSDPFPELRILGSTGEPWDEETYLWFFNAVGKKRCPIINISGGTEIMGCLLSPNPLSPLKPTSLYGPGLGVDARIWDEEGNEINEGIGHLVCLSPLPSMTKGFLGSKERYLRTYFEKFGEKVWYHGDWAMKDSDGLWFLKGRSDDTIKVAGKRVGPNEYESALMEDKRVQEVAAVGIPHEIKGEGVFCYVVLKKEEKDIDRVRKELHQLASERMGKALQPEQILFTQSLPKTRSGKILRGLIRKQKIGEAFDSSSAENPDSLEDIQKAI